MKILVLDVPGLHLGYLGCYGNDWIATPYIDRLASESVVFDRHYFDVDQPSPFAWTGHQPLPSAEPSSTRPSPHPGAPTLGEILTARAVSHELIAAEDAVSIKGLQDVVAKTKDMLAKERALAGVYWPSLLPPWQLPSELLDSYCEDDDKPWLDPPSGPLENPDDLIRLQNTYAAVVTYVDAQIGQVLDATRDHALLDDTLICLTAPHGIALGEHAVIGMARPSLHEELVHLPLVMRLPGGAHAGARVAALTQPVDLFPTFLEFLGIAPPPTHGNSLWPVIRGDTDQVRAHACSGARAGEAVEWSLRTLEWAFLLPATAVDTSRRPQLYVKPEDRWEVNDVRQHHLDLVETLEKTLRDVAAATSCLPAPSLPDAAGPAPQ
jgi:arylsulfatase A-like enzyme